MQFISVTASLMAGLGRYEEDCKQNYSRLHSSSKLKKLEFHRNSESNACCRCLHPPKKCLFQIFRAICQFRQTRRIQWGKSSSIILKPQFSVIIHPVTLLKLFKFTEWYEMHHHLADFFYQRLRRIWIYSCPKWPQSTIQQLGIFSSNTV